MASCLVYPIIYYHAVYISTSGFFQVCSLVALMYLIEIYVGQKWLEGIEPFTISVKSYDNYFLTCDAYNTVFLSAFHNTVTLLLRLDIRLDLLDSSNVMLRKILDRMKKVP